MIESLCGLSVLYTLYFNPKSSAAKYQQKTNNKKKTLLMSSTKFNICIQFTLKTTCVGIKLL